MAGNETRLERIERRLKPKCDEGVVKWLEVYYDGELHERFSVPAGKHEYWNAETSTWQAEKVEHEQNQT